ncbi:MAG: hypothetical protein V2A79_07695 [Planctomycetota bacterium]
MATAARLMALLSAGWLGILSPAFGEPCVSPAAGGYDGDMDVDLADFAAFQRCFSGMASRRVDPGGRGDRWG